MAIRNKKKPYDREAMKAYYEAMDRCQNVRQMARDLAKRIGAYISLTEMDECIRAANMIENKIDSQLPYPAYPERESRAMNAKAARTTAARKRAATKRKRAAAKT